MTQYIVVAHRIFVSEIDYVAHTCGCDVVSFVSNKKDAAKMSIWDASDIVKHMNDCDPSEFNTIFYIQRYVDPKPTFVMPKVDADDHYRFDRLGREDQLLIGKMFASGDRIATIRLIRSLGNTGLLSAKRYAAACADFYTTMEEYNKKN